MKLWLFEPAPSFDALVAAADQNAKKPVKRVKPAN